MSENGSRDLQVWPAPSFDPLGQALGQQLGVPDEAPSNPQDSIKTRDTCLLELLRDTVMVLAQAGQGILACNLAVASLQSPHYRRRAIERAVADALLLDHETREWRVEDLRARTMLWTLGAEACKI